MNILYIAGFRNEYNDNVFIQLRKKAVISHFENSSYKIDFLYNSPTEHPLILANAKIYYSTLLPCNVTSNFIENTHRRLFKFSRLYSTLTLRVIQKKLSLKIDSYDAIIAETWENLSAIIPFVTGRKIIGRVYGTGNLTESIENNSIWKLNPFFNRMKQVVNSDKIIGVIFNSTGSRSEDLFNLLSESNEKLAPAPAPAPVYLDMPNAPFSSDKPKKRLKDGTLRLLQVGRMTDGHGFDLTIKIIQRLVHKYNFPVMAHLVGYGVSYDKTCELVKAKDLTKYIRLPGCLGLDELKRLYANADVVINYYGFNPVIEALNYKAFVITREFGEIGKILQRVFNEKVFRVCLPDQPVLNIDDTLRDQYVQEVVNWIVWYFQNNVQLNDFDFIPIRKITTEDFAKDVFRHYQGFLKEIHIS